MCRNTRTGTDPWHDPALPGTTWTVSYTYDDDGNREWLVTPDDTLVEYAYTARNQIASITTGGPPPMATFAYDLNGNRVSKVLKNGISTSYTYDVANRLLTVDHRKAAASFARFDYTLNAVGNRASKTVGRSGQTPLTETYTYDPTDQLTNVNYGTGRTTAFNYTTGGWGASGEIRRRRTRMGDMSGSKGVNCYAVGNRLTVADSAGIVPASYSANSLNQYTAVAGTAPTYDVNGNLAAYAGQTFTYDSENRLLTATNASSTVTTTYDARRRAVSRTVGGVTTYFVWDGWSLIEEHNASGNLVAKYVHGPVVDEILAKTDTAATVFPHHDGLGSTAALTNDTGAPVESHTYDVYGQPTILDPSTLAPRNSSLFAVRHLFTGREWISEAGIYDYRNRAYSPALGRFLQTDPIRFDAGDVNLYRYVFNAPARWSDPTGEGFWDWLSPPDTPPEWLRRLNHLRWLEAGIGIAVGIRDYDQVSDICDSLRPGESVFVATAWGQFWGMFLGGPIVSKISKDACGNCHQDYFFERLELPTAFPEPIS